MKKQKRFQWLINTAASWPLSQLLQNWEFGGPQSLTLLIGTGGAEEGASQQCSSTEGSLQHRLGVPGDVRAPSITINLSPAMGIKTVKRSSPFSSKQSPHVRGMVCLKAHKLLGNEGAGTMAATQSSYKAGGRWEAAAAHTACSAPRSAPCNSNTHTAPWAQALAALARAPCPFFTLFLHLCDISFKFLNSHSCSSLRWAHARAPVCTGGWGKWRITKNSN